jgi:hypothetical protein
VVEVLHQHCIDVLPLGRGPKAASDQPLVQAVFGGFARILHHEIKIPGLAVKSILGIILNLNSPCKRNFASREHYTRPERRQEQSQASRLECIGATMYDSSMKSETYPLAMPPDLLTEVRQTAKHTGLSIADAMRQSMRLGLPKLRDQLSSAKVKPMTAEEARKAFAPDPEWDRLESIMAKRPVRPPKD